jgi:hypothetical protein
MKSLLLVLILILVANLAIAESFQYVIVGEGNGKKVTGYVTGYDNGTIQGTVDDKFVTGEWTGLGICTLSDGKNFYEMEVLFE